MSHSLRILFAAAEASPLVKVGGLGDVAGSLPLALRQRGHDVRIIMPGYSSINLEGYHCNHCGRFVLSFLNNQESIGINEVLLQDGTPIYLVENERYFDRPAVYGEADDLERFLLFSRAVMEVPKRLDWQPDVLHSHDWHTGMAPALLRVAFAYRDDIFYSRCASVCTIHNIAYKGWFDHYFAIGAGLYDYLPPPEDPIRSKSYSVLALGIYHSDIISTVSKTHAAEILTPEYGMGLEMLLQRRQDSLLGILNGIDYDQFNPANDRLIAANYDIENLDKRVTNRLTLQDKAGLPVNPGPPLVRRTGGLAETVPDCTSDLSSGLGFVFEGYDAGELLMALRRALAAWQHKDRWQQLMRRVMQSDFSWKPSLPQYEALYEMAIRKKTEK